MGTRLPVNGEGICKGVVLQLQNIDVVEDYLPLKLGQHRHDSWNIVRDVRRHASQLENSHNAL